MPWTAKEIEEKRAEALALLQDEKENALARAYEQARTMLIDKSNEFNPQQHIGNIQYMQDEYDAVIQGEEQFKQNQWSLIEKILTLLVMLGVLKKNDTYEQNSSNLLDDLHWFLEDAELAKQIMTLWLPELPKTSGQYISEWVTSFQKHLKSHHKILQDLKTMITPEDLENELLDIFFDKDREQWTQSWERVLSKAWIDMVHEYRKLYETKYQEIEQRGVALVTERKQLIYLVIKEAKHTWLVEWNELQNQWDSLHVADLSDAEIEEYGKEIQNEVEVKQNYLRYSKVKYTKLEKIMNQLLFPEWDIWNAVTWWKIKNEDVLYDWIRIRDEWKQNKEENQKLIVQLQFYIDELDKEQKLRVFEKNKQKYTLIIQKLKQQYATLEDQFLPTEKKEIEKKRKVLWEKLVQWVQIDMQQVVNEINELEQQFREWKNNPNFKKRVELVVQTKFLVGSIEHRIIEQGLFWLTDDDLKNLPEKLAKQEQEGKKPEELILKNQRSPELKQSQAEKRAWAEKQSEKEKYWEVANIIDKYFNTWKIKEWIHNGRWEVQISGINLKNKTNYAIRKKAVEVPKDWSRWKWGNRIYVKWSAHYYQQSNLSAFAFGEKAKETDLIFEGTINNESQKLSNVLKENVYDQWYELPEWNVKTYENDHMTLMKQLLPQHLHQEKRLVRWFAYLCDAPLRQWYLHPWEVKKNKDWTYKWFTTQSWSRLYMRADNKDHWWYTIGNINDNMAILPCRSR